MTQPIEPNIQVQVNGNPFFATNNTIIGRGHDGIHIDHSQVSRQHAQFKFNNGNWTIEDLGSTNGLSKGQNRVNIIHLVPGENQVWLGPLESAPKITIHVPQITQNFSEPTNQNKVEIAEVESTVRHDKVSTLAKPELAENLGRPTGVFSLKHLVVGRDTNCHITLDDPLVSRQHAELNIDHSMNGTIQDLGSANGTFVNGQRIQQATLHNGDLIEIGRTQFLLKDGQLEQHIAYGLPLQAQNLSVTVGDNLKILQNISFMLPAGSMTAIVGPSGSGKSTLLNALTGRRKANTGRVYLGGRDLYSSQENIGRSIGFVPQDDPIHESLTVRSALTAAARLREPASTSKDQIANDVNNIAKELGLSQRLDTRVSQLSGGQKKRVSVGYEMVAAPQALILDEPTSGLDPGLERELMLNLRELANKGTTTVVVTHSIQSLELCDRVIVLAPGGQMVFSGKPDQITKSFGCSTIAEVFNLLSTQPPQTWSQKVAANQIDQELSTFSIHSQTDLKTPKRSFLFDLRILTKRFLMSLIGDKKKLGMMLLQPPLIGLVVSFAIGRNAFGLLPGTAAYQYVLITVLVMTWFGTFNSIREIVDEKKQFKREQSVGVSSHAFVLSKWLVLVCIVFFQAIALHAFTSFRQLSRIGYGALFVVGELEYILALAGVGASCVGLGLIVSAVAKDAAKAVISLPMVLIFVVLFSGLLLPTEGRLIFEEVSLINPVQWGGSAAAATIDLQEANGCNTAPESGDDVLTGFMKLLQPKIYCSSRWEPTPSNQALNFVMITILGLFMLLLGGATTRWTLSRPDNR